MKFYIADCFAEAKYQGNQLAVLIPDRPVDDGEMQRIAIETGFSETAFIMSGRRSNGGYDVRIFTTSCEVPFAGHPTLGTAYVIREILESGCPSKVILNLKAGQIPVEFTPDGRGIMTQNQPVFGDRHSLSYTVSQGSEMGRPSRLYVDAAYDPVSGLYSTHVGGRVFMVAEGEWR